MAGLEIPGLDISPLSASKRDYGKWLLHGPQGAGKTTLGATLAACGKMLLIDLVGEKGLISLYDFPHWENIDITRPTSATDFDDLFWKLNEGKSGYKVVMIDSLTALQKMTNRFILGHNETAVREIKRGTAPADQRSWGQSLDVMQDVATFWFGLADGNRANPIHVVMTAQTKFVEDDQGRILNRVPDVQRGALGLTLAAPDYVLYLETEENPDALIDETLPPSRHIVRFGSHPGYKTKARVPVAKRGKIPPILGRKQPVDLVALSRILGIGGLPPRTPAAAEPAKAAPAAKRRVAAPAVTTPTEEK